MTRKENPANPGTDEAFDVCAGKPTDITSKTLGPQWEVARDMERRSAICGRSALTMRGADRFNALALASTYAVAARDAVMIGAAA